jgi:ABC-type bacteriocin/lantibiotic exporter with double-glycine peptidase domain
MFIGIKTFPRIFQLDDWSCGSRSIQATLKFFGIHRPHWFLTAQLKTSPDAGTAVHQMVRVLRRHGLRVGYRPNLSWRELVQALKVGAVAVVHLDGDHIAVAHAVTEHHVLLADPSILRCPGRRQTRRRFLERWTRWGLLVSRRLGSQR